MLLSPSIKPQKDATGKSKLEKQKSDILKNFAIIIRNYKYYVPRSVKILHGPLR